MSFPSYEDVQKARSLLAEVSEAHWLQDDLHKPSWWLLLALTILPYVIWWKMVDRRRIQEIVLYGLLIALICMTFDSIGTDRLWWAILISCYISRRRCFPPTSCWSRCSP
ncbi:hypothetical protein J2T17_001584 [Paenibacillus mucilaginosus]